MDDMAHPRTLAELDGQVAEIRGETNRRLGLVPFAGRYGDWDALIRKHRDMLAILEWSGERYRELRAPADRAGAYAQYVAAFDQQLVLERAVLEAAESYDIDEYESTCSALARAVYDVRAAGQRAGLRSTRPSLARRTRTWVLLPWHIVRAHRHARAEHRAGRRWR